MHLILSRLVPRYNHATFNDVVLSGVVGLQPPPPMSTTLVVNPLVPDGALDYFAADGVFVLGRTITVLYDRAGTRYGNGAGLVVLVDGKKAASAPELQSLRVDLAVAQ